MVAMVLLPLFPPPPLDFPEEVMTGGRPNLSRSTCLVLVGGLLLLAFCVSFVPTFLGGEVAGKGGGELVGMGAFPNGGRGVFFGGGGF